MSKNLKSNKPLIKKGLLKELPLAEYGAWFLISVVAAVIFSLSVEPWVNFSKYILPGKNLLFFSFLSHVPVIGFLGDLVNSQPVKAVGVILFLFFNLCQVVLLLMVSRQVSLSPEWQSKVSALSTIGYVFEAVVATMTHPFYGSGMGGFLNDSVKFQIDAHLISWGEVTTVAALLFTFEAFVWAGIIIIFAMRQTHRRSA